MLETTTETPQPEVSIRPIITDDTRPTTAAAAEEETRVNNAVVVGLQWGDEGKGKIVDILAQRAKACCRYNGGANAGHTVVVKDSKYKMHLLPSGILHANVLNIIGNGCVVDFEVLNTEVESLLNGKVLDSIDEIRKRLVISDRAHCVLALHRAVDALIEERRGSARLGTTGRGIGPAYAAKATRNGIRVCDLFNPVHFRNKYMVLYEEYHYRFGNGLRLMVNPDEDVQKYLDFFNKFRDCCRDSVCLCNRIARGVGGGGWDFGILAESANGTMLDLDLGTYPYVTSSSPIASTVGTGLGVSLRNFNLVIGVCKAYITRVGEGPFPTELTDEIGRFLQKNGAEFGATTGRPRRCGWLDIPLLIYSCVINDVDAIVITKLDVLTGLPKLKICVGYKHKVSGKLLEEVAWPACLVADDDGWEPIYEEMDGWNEDLSEMRDWGELPNAAIRYLTQIEKRLRVHNPRLTLSGVGVGQDRQAMIKLKSPPLW